MSTYRFMCQFPDGSVAPITIKQDDAAVARMLELQDAYEAACAMFGTSTEEQP